MADNREAEQQTEQETINSPKSRTRLDRFISHEGELTITPPKPEKPADKKHVGDEPEKPQQ